MGFDDFHRRECFVFGSNKQGHHSKGAALEAKLEWGAVYGQPEGPQGDSYAIPTKELRPWKPPVTLDEIGAGVLRFLLYAKGKPNRRFRVSAIGTGLAGFTAEQVAPFFAIATDNVRLPREFQAVLERNARKEEDIVKVKKNV